MLHTEFKHLGLPPSRTPSALRPKINLNSEANLMQRLAHLSLRSQWILYTAQCQRPNSTALSELNINCGKIVQLKASKRHSEAEVVAKAIACQTASAIVASSSIDLVTQKQLLQFAKQHNCELFFIRPPAYSLH